MAKILTGKVISTKMLKTAVVRVERSFAHRLYQKIIKRHKNYLVDYGELKLKVGDVVTIQECRPLSKNKHFRAIKNS